VCPHRKAEQGATAKPHVVRVSLISGFSFMLIALVVPALRLADLWR
jgi:hypothetical protein